MRVAGLRLSSGIRHAQNFKTHQIFWSGIWPAGATDWHSKDLPPRLWTCIKYPTGSKLGILGDWQTADSPFSFNA